MYAIEVVNLVKRYGDFEALKGVTLRIKENEIFALLGPNGAGKTTVLRIIAEGLSYDSGEVKVFGRKLSREALRFIGYVPQEDILYNLLTVEENLQFYADLFDAPAERIDDLIERFSLPRKKKVRELSGGFRKRLSIAVTLLHDPRIIILDEPSTGLDVPSRRELWRIIRELKEEGKTIILATHYMEEAEVLSDRVAIMNEGRVIAVGTVEELKRLAGQSSVLHIEGTIVGAENLGSNVLVKENYVRIPVEDPRKELPKVIDVLLKSGSEIRLVRVEEPTLEDVFLKLTGRGLE
ncbi:ABC transporter ATP-binding protein [Pyrococcus kukulkanii]|uniref:Daunorubicin ABC transporter ATP-binding protein n=1 Tax=Pyrococcus kukulkanii TaxID=1609559 RepID=A0A127BAC5_9EURY|nr:ABC transporter ATP-binding protein [Pyrococcus kukulkanii]AMM54273.1 daunorubicin ABC transporter ATP-binding protein [Pyrococcus kukulkanii]